MHKTLAHLQELTGLHFDGVPFERDLASSTFEDSAKALWHLSRFRVDANHVLATTRQTLAEGVRTANSTLAEVKDARSRG